MKIKLLIALTLVLAMLAVGCGKGDADLTKAASDKLAAENLAGVSVVIKDGVATLTGEVADAAARSRAEAIVRSVDGVKSVTNSLTLKPLPVATPAAPDPALTGKITENLKNAGCTTATVTVSNGKVTVTGEVPAAKYQSCIQVIQQSGITGIDNQLRKGN